MAINFPTALDTFTNPSSTDAMNGAIPHHSQHADANDAIEALEVKVGINGSAVTTTLDYKTAPPDAITFTDQVDVNPAAVVTSNAVTLNGNAGRVWPLCVRGDGTPTLRVNSLAWGDYGTAMDGDTVQIRLTSSGTALAERTAYLYADGRTSTVWSVTTIAGFDSDAAAFFTASGVSDSTQQNATNALVLALKAASLWTKLKAIYPFVGGTATTHKYNLKDPQDTDGAYRITFTGTVTHNANGITGDGSTGYGDTHFNPSTNFVGAADGSMGIYSRSDSSSGTNPYDFGCSSGADANAFITIAKYSSGATYCGYGTNTYPSASGLSGAGLFTTSRSSGTITKGYRNATEIISASDTVTMENRSLYICCSNKGGTATYFSPKNLAFAFIGDGLTAGEVSDLYTAVQAFQTSLSRNV